MSKFCHEVKALRKAINVKNMMKRKYYKYRTSNNWETYRTHRNMVVNMRRDCERTFLRETCSKLGDGKDFWKCIKPLISNKKQIHE